MEIQGFRSQNHQRETELTRMRKKKRLINDDNHDHQPAGLFLNIRYAEGIDYPVAAVARHYCVLYWVHPGQEFHTRVVQALFNPSWNELDMVPLPLRNHTHYGFLNLEVLRLGSHSDPGPSSGVVIVGRARVPLPKQPSREIVGRFGLVRPDAQGHKAEAGHIILAMELTTQVVDSEAPFHCTHN